MAEHKRSSFSEWLEQLQQESWQLELLLSGFAIFLLIGAHDSLNSMLFSVIELQGSVFASLILMYFMLYAAWYVMVINLIVHVVLRGLWISAIGLRYVVGDSGVERLNLKGPFSRSTEDHTSDLDKFIQKLEEICSVIFAFTFLIVLLMFSFGLFNVIGALLAGLGLWIKNAAGLGDSNWWQILAAIWAIGGVICAVDFLGLGWMRRNRVLSKYFFPIHKVYSTATLTFTYKSLYYNLIAGKFGWRGFGILVAYMLCVVLVQNVGFRSSGYIPEFNYDRTFHNYYYDDAWDADAPAGRASIPSYHVSNGYIELFLPYNANDDDPVIEHICPNLKTMPRGIRWVGQNFPIFDVTENIDADSVLLCNEKRFKITINDSLYSDAKFRFRKHSIRKRKGFFTILDVDYLPRGEHQLKLDVMLPRPSHHPKPFDFVDIDVIPFWVDD